jgi:hypothetical protein
MRSAASWVAMLLALTAALAFALVGRPAETLGDVTTSHAALAYSYDVQVRHPSPLVDAYAGFAQGTPSKRLGELGSTSSQVALGFAAEDTTDL